MDDPGSRPSFLGEQPETRAEIKAARVTQHAPPSEPLAFIKSQMSLPTQLHQRQGNRAVFPTVRPNHRSSSGRAAPKAQSSTIFILRAPPKFVTGLEMTASLRRLQLFRGGRPEAKNPFCNHKKKSEPTKPRRLTSKDRDGRQAPVYKESLP